MRSRHWELSTHSMSAQLMPSLWTASQDTDSRDSLLLNSWLHLLAVLELFE